VVPYRGKEGGMEEVVSSTARGIPGAHCMPPAAYFVSSSVSQSALSPLALVEQSFFLPLQFDDSLLLAFSNKLIAPLLLSLLAQPPVS
jgi:hypothetical protein